LVKVSLPSLLPLFPNTTNKNKAKPTKKQKQKKKTHKIKNKISV